MYPSRYAVYYQMNMLCFTPIEQLDDWGRYLYGFYFLVSLITTIAFGDIIGKNPMEEVQRSLFLGVRDLPDDHLDRHHRTHSGAVYEFGEGGLVRGLLVCVRFSVMA